MHTVSRYFLLLATSLLATSGLMAKASASPGHHEVDLAVTYTVQHINLVSNPTFEFQCRGVNAAPERLFGECGEPAFHQIAP